MERDSEQSAGSIARAVGPYLVAAGPVPVVLLCLLSLFPGARDAFLSVAMGVLVFWAAMILVMWVIFSAARRTHRRKPHQIRIDSDCVRFDAFGGARRALVKDIELIRLEQDQAGRRVMRLVFQSGRILSFGVPDAAIVNRIRELLPDTIAWVDA